MSDTLPIFRREILMKAFNGELTLVSAFEQLVAYVEAAAAAAQSGATIANILSEASLLTLGASAGLDSARIFTPGAGVSFADAGGRLTINLNDLTPKIGGGFPVTFLVTGATNLILPVLGTLATLGDVSTAVGGSVTSFNTRTGAVTLTSVDVTTALTYSPTSVTGLTGVQSVAAFKTGLSINNVDNTADAAKNVLSATKLFTSRSITLTGDGAWTVNFDGSANVTAPLTLATVNANTGPWGSATQSPQITLDAKGRATAAANVTITPAVGSITGLGSGVGAALAVNIGSAGAPVLFNGALGTPLSGTLTNCTFPTLNQNTTGSAAKWTTARNLAGNSVDGSANVAFANKFIVQGTADTGLSAAQFLGALGTGIIKNTTTTGVLSIAIAADFPTLNQSTTGSAATLTTPRNIDGQAFDGSAAITVIAPGTHAATSKATPVDADEVPLVDSAASNVLKKLTWANVKATLKTYFDTLYVSIAGLGSGVATFLATPSSANLAAALTDETGTGSVVFSAAPTLSGTVTINGGVTTTDNNNNFVQIGQYSAGAPNSYILANAPTGVLQVGGVDQLKWTTAGVTIAGLAQCATFRINQAPTAGVVAGTHTVPININGSAARMIVAIP